MFKIVDDKTSFEQFDENKISEKKEYTTRDLVEILNYIEYREYEKRRKYLNKLRNKMIKFSKISNKEFKKLNKNENLGFEKYINLLDSLEKKYFLGIPNSKEFIVKVVRSETNKRKEDLFEYFKMINETRLRKKLTELKGKKIKTEILYKKLLEINKDVKISQKVIQNYEYYLKELDDFINILRIQLK